MKIKNLIRVCALSLALITVAGAGTVPMAAAEPNSLISAVASVNNNYRFTVKSDNTLTITKYTGQESNVNIPQSIGGKTVTEIGSSAFKGCTSIKSIFIPKSVRTINGNAFIGCTNLQSFKTDQNNSYYTTVNGVLFSKNKTVLKLYPNGRSGAYTVPAGVTLIDKYAFSECNKLTAVTIPASVKTIEFNALAYCLGLKKLTLNKGLTTLKIAAFNGCKNLEAINLPESVTTIEKYAFSSCKTLKSIVIPQKVTELNFSLFEGCTSLNSVQLPDGITKVYSNVFDHCSSLTGVTLPKSVKIIYGMAFCCCENLRSVTILSNNAKIDKIAFKDCPNLTIYASKGSTAEAAAKANGVKFSDKKAPFQNLSAVSISGRTLNITAKAVGGANPYNVAVYYRNTNEKSWRIAQNYSSNTNIKLTLPKAGTYNVCIRIKDADGRLTSKDYSVAVK